MVDALNSDQMVQQAMRMRGYGRWRDASDGTSGLNGPGQAWPDAGQDLDGKVKQAGRKGHHHGGGGHAHKPDNDDDDQNNQYLQQLAGQYSQGIPNFGGSADGASSVSGTTAPDGTPQLSFANGRARHARHGDFKNNPQMAAEMDALKKVLDQTKDSSQDDKQTQLVNWANAYNVPVPPPGSKWFWEA
jgi:hypothetical protein